MRKIKAFACDNERKGERMKQKTMKDLQKEYEAASMSGEALQDMKRAMDRAKMEKKRAQRIGLIVKSVAAVAAAFVILPNTSANVAYAMGQMPVIGGLVEMVTFREYHYEDEHHVADIDVQAPVVAEIQPETAAQQMEENGAPVQAATETLQKTTEEIRAEIDQITEQIIAEFKEGLKEEDGYQSIAVDSEVISTTDSYFTLKLICYQGAGSGVEWNYFYTIDLASGERMALKDLFLEGADYITPISENIKKQMHEQMAADENVKYWLDDEEVPERNFQQITEETSFYINENNEIVIAFNEGDVAPMYMGCVEFVIDDVQLAEIRK